MTFSLATSHPYRSFKRTRLGMTLVELMVVLVVVSALVGFISIRLDKPIDSSYDREAQVSLRHGLFVALQTTNENKGFFGPDQAAIISSAETLLTGEDYNFVPIEDMINGDTAPDPKIVGVRYDDRYEIILCNQSRKARWYCLKTTRESLTASGNTLVSYLGYTDAGALAKALGTPIHAGGSVQSVMAAANKIEICHATSSDKNPYVRINVSVNGLNGHGDHEDDLIPAPDGGCPAVLVGDGGSSGGGGGSTPDPGPGGDSGGGTTPATEGDGAPGDDTSGDPDLGPAPGEDGHITTVPDADGDGTANVSDPDVDGDGNSNSSDPDINGDGTTNQQDLDVDGDGIPNISDPDVDGDGRSNDDDPDVDGDGVKNKYDSDIDGDGIPNGSDPDVDGDGLLNANDPDIDSDDVPNTSDWDADGDGRHNQIDADVYGTHNGSLNEVGEREREHNFMGLRIGSAATVMGAICEVDPDSC